MTIPNDVAIRELEADAMIRVVIAAEAKAKAREALGRVRERCCNLWEIEIEAKQRERGEKQEREGAREANIRAYDAENAVQELRDYFEQCEQKAARDADVAEGGYEETCRVRRACYRHAVEMIDTYFPPTAEEPDSEGDDVLRDFLRGVEVLRGKPIEQKFITAALAEICRRALEGGTGGR